MFTHQFPSRRTPLWAGRFREAYPRGSTSVKFTESIRDAIKTREIRPRGVLRTKLNSRDAIWISNCILTRCTRHQLHVIGDAWRFRIYSFHGVWKTSIRVFPWQPLILGFLWLCPIQWPPRPRFLLFLFFFFAGSCCPPRAFLLPPPSDLSCSTFALSRTRLVTWSQTERGEESPFRINRTNGWFL